jgi:hypothetical protein
VLIHAKPATRRSWDFRAKEGFYIGPALDSYRCFKLVKSDTKSQVISDTVEFRHAYRAIPLPSPEDKIIHGLQAIAGALKDAPLPSTITQLEAITNLRDLFESSKGAQPGTSKGGHAIVPLTHFLSSTSSITRLCHPQPSPIGHATMSHIRRLSLATGCCPISKGGH